MIQLPHCILERGQQRDAKVKKQGTKGLLDYVIWKRLVAGAQIASGNGSRHASIAGIVPIKAACSLKFDKPFHPL
jgi:hypothetical protein